ncbi:MAG: serine/threonine protein kinase [Acidobacteriota bacterium]|nr:serine/threonine protein kinase [Acidobacteriota bacterium]MDH3784453.1 serine/threonine protein kinase [Acidobacteriota bacterium]
MRSCPSCRSAVTGNSTSCGNCGADVPTSADITQTSISSTTSSVSGIQTTAGDRFAPGVLLADRYRIIGPLGKGGMGEVYRADDVKLGQSVALKFLPIELAQNPDRLRRFLHEVRIARQVSHANVCRVYDISEIDGQHFISMEFVDGEDLSTLLRRIGRISSDKATQIARQICAGLHAAHTQGIIHRDLKPANIMLDGRGQVRITDFGLAGLAEEFSGNEVRVGTPAYMSPEQLSGKEVTVQSDVYALGLVLYELFTGDKAFDASSVAEISRLQQESMPSTPTTLVPDIDPLVEQAILRCLEKDSSRRPASALNVAASLPGGDPLAAALAAGETPSPEMVADAGRSEGLHPGIVLGLVATSLVALAMLIWMSDQLRLPNFFPEAKPPAALMADARNIITEMGYSDAALDRIGGYAYDNDYQNDRTDTLSGSDAWRDLHMVRPSPLIFIYRQSPNRLVASRAAGAPSSTNPPLVLAGMISVTTDSSGRLLSFVAVPDERTPDESEGGKEEPVDIAEPDWIQPISLAGLDLETLQEVAPVWSPVVHADVRKAWTAHYPDNDEIVHVDVGATAGRVNWMRVTADWTERTRTAQTTGGANQTVGIVILSIVAVLVLIAGLVARRHIRLGRSDTRGALRLALFMVGVNLATWLLVAHHVATVGAELFLLIDAIKTSLFLGAMVWTFYVAVEPYMRKLWPDTLISWTRLLTGRWKDPWVGRDLLVGVAGGAIMSVLGSLTTLLPSWLGKTAIAPSAVSVAALDGYRQAMGITIGQVRQAMILPVAVLFLLVIFRIVFRGRKISVAATFVMMTVIQAAGALTTISDPLVITLTIVVSALVWLMLVTIIVRRGLLAAAVTIISANILSTIPLTANLGAWYASTAYLTLLLPAALTVFAAWAALGGRKFQFDKLLQD